MKINSHVIDQAISCAFEYPLQSIQQEFIIVAREMQRPSVLFKPRVFIDGNQWCALYGDNIQEGIAGFGDTVKSAMFNFDNEWNTRLTMKKDKNND